jgi:tRNA U34 5-methylaminomethyl-2-thiouridine-forming methyltransferase MnmC
LIKNDSIQLKLTEDGSQTLYVPAIDETYHSVHGAVSESLHVFIQAAWQQCPKQELRILEVGFGTGLNAYLSAIEAEKESKMVHYTAVEKYPLSEEIWQSLNYAQNYGCNQPLFQDLHSAEWGKEESITPHFSLQKQRGDFLCLPLSQTFDLIYFDAFSPEKQPELWTEEVFAKLYAHTSVGGILTTYCAKGAVRRAMQAVGYMVERIAGAAGKREMLSARKL